MCAVISLPWFFPSYVRLDRQWLSLNKISTKKWQTCENKTLIHDLYIKNIPSFSSFVIKKKIAVKG